MARPVPAIAAGALPASRNTSSMNAAEFASGCATIDAASFCA